MNYFIVRDDDDDLFVFRKKKQRNCFTNKKFPENKEA